MIESQQYRNTSVQVEHKDICRKLLNNGEEREKVRESNGRG
jgi:hypothetical protein